MLRKYFNANSIYNQPYTKIYILYEKEFLFHFISVRYYGVRSSTQIKSNDVMKDDAIVVPLTRYFF